MNPRTARLFVLGTSLLAMVSISVAMLLGLRLRETRAEMAELVEEDACSPAAPQRGAR
jgi:hypothetical protein